MSDATTVLPPGKRALVTILVMVAMMIVVLDSTIANVALPHMQASLSATSESISWVLTSFILASAVALPVTGFLSDKLGRRVMFTGAIIGFTLSSMMCGVATSMPVMVAARILQGLFGACLAPMSQAILYDINPPEKHERAMTIWGTVLMIGPITGPVLGGWITDNFDWRWVFFINVPIGIAAATGSWLLLSGDTKEKRRFDLFGFVLLGLACSGMQLALDRGVSLDWFESTEIWIELGIAVSAFWMFVVHTITRNDTIVPRALFLDRNFVVALAATAVVSGILIAGSALVAPMLQRLMNYPVLDAGLMTAPRGLGTMAGMLSAGRLSRIAGSRPTILIGLLLLATSLWVMTGFNLEMDRTLVLLSGLVQGFGFGFISLPLNMLAFATLPIALRTEGAALYNLARSIGSSVAISVLTALIASNTQTSHSDLGANVTTISAPFLTSGLLERAGFQGGEVMQMIDAEINRQAVMIAYIDDYWVMMWAAILLIPMVILLKGASSTDDTLVFDPH
jgi:DHA2 family multidrug resistance protein